ncbi:MAG: hypothetical protein IJG13_20610 [Kiritimatiellae bacterium]|nr:hypothetical protein [Kiritimatiellia bacterium]
MRSLLALGAFALCLAPSSFAGENPVTRLFPQDLSFHVTFDDETVNPSLGATPITRVSKRPQGGFAFADGLFGKGLTVGWPGWKIDPGNPIIDMSRPGTAVCWVKLVKTPKPRDAIGRKWEAGGGFFSVRDDKGNAYLFGKSTDCGVGNGQVWFHCFVKRENGMRVNTWCARSCSVDDWTEGTWRMFAFSWTADALCVSIDGAPFAAHPCPLPLGELKPTTLSFRGVAYGKPGWWLVDECSVLTRKLSDEEVRTLYEKTKKEAGI